MNAQQLAAVRRELRLASAEIEAALWAIEAMTRLPAQVVDSTDAGTMVKRAVMAAALHLDRAKP